MLFTTPPLTALPEIHGAAELQSVPPVVPPEVPPVVPPGEVVPPTDPTKTTDPTKASKLTTPTKQQQQSGALGAVTTPTSTGALPGTLTPTMLAGASIKDDSGMAQLAQLYPQLANVDPKLLQVLTGRIKPATIEAAETEEGTGFVGSKLAGVPSPGNPVSGNDNSTMIPGMRKLSHANMNMAASDAGPLDPTLMKVLAKHRWDREPTHWSQ